MLIPFFASNIPLPIQSTDSYYQQVVSMTNVETKIDKPEPIISEVPFYSQFSDISSPKWKKKGCGITSLAMVIDFYKLVVPVDELLTEGVASGAYLKNVGWTYKGLIDIAQKYDLEGSSYDLSNLGISGAFKEFETKLNDGPVIASVHYKFDPQSKIPHLVVINRIDKDIIYYNDPAANKGDKQISVSDFKKAWKMRFIVLRPIVKKENILKTV